MHDSDPSVDNCFDMDCSQPAAFLSPFSHVHIPSTHVYALFASDLVLVKIVAVGEMSTLNSIACTILVVAAYCICVYMLPSW